MGEQVHRQAIVLAVLNTTRLHLSTVQVLSLNIARLLLNTVQAALNTALHRLITARLRRNTHLRPQNTRLLHPNTVLPLLNTVLQPAHHTTLAVLNTAPHHQTLAAVTTVALQLWAYQNQPVRASLNTVHQVRLKLKTTISAQLAQATPQPVLSIHQPVLATRQLAQVIHLTIPAKIKRQD